MVDLGGNMAVLEVRKISKSFDEEEIIKGHIKLIIGYLDFDEDGGAANGLQEDIEYYCDEIIEKIDSFIASQTLIKEFESKAVESIESVLEHC